MKRESILVIDAVVNLLLGSLLLLLVPFPSLSRTLGVPEVDVPFYASILGAVLFGIGIALILESRRRRGEDQLVGLGLGGAVAINLCGGLVLIGWLIFGDLGLPMRGNVFLWSLAVVLVGLSGVEILPWVIGRYRG